jgi:hypothetical protein
MLAFKMSVSSLASNFSPGCSSTIAIASSFADTIRSLDEGIDAVSSTVARLLGMAAPVIASASTSILSTVAFVAAAECVAALARVMAADSAAAAAAAVAAAARTDAGGCP